MTDDAGTTAARGGTADPAQPLAPELERGTSLVGLATILVVAIPPITFAASGQGALVPPLWWLAYLLVLVPFVVTATGFVAHDEVLDGRLLVPLMLVGSLAAMGIAPEYGFSVALPILAVVTGAFVYGLRGGIILTVVCAGSIIVMGLLILDDTPTVAIVQGLTFGGFMGFGVATVESSQRAARGRAELAVLNTELADTNRRLLATRAELELSSRSAERLRIARDLHDVVGHQLTALSLQLEGAVHRVSGPGEQEVVRARGIASDLLAQVREVVSQLREDPGGRQTALEALHGLAELTDRPAVEVRVDAEDLPPEPDRAQTVLRMVQEAVTNAVRHAGADRVLVEISHMDDGGSGHRSVVRVVDDGRGTVDLQPGNGLTGMDERISQAGGQLTIRSRPGEGTTIEATVPW